MAENLAVRDRTLGALLTAASLVFTEKGASASMSEIAEAAGVGRATLYRYFPTRESMVATLFEAAIAEAATKIGSLRLDDMEIQAALESLAAVMLALAHRYTLLLQDEPHIAHKHRARETIGPPLEKFFSNRIAAGEIRPGLSSESLAFYFGGLLRPGAIMLAEQGKDISQVARELAGIFCGGIAAPKVSGPRN